MNIIDAIYSEKKNVRIVMNNGEPWFIAKDVAQILGYKNTRDALRVHVDAEDKGVVNHDTLGGKQKMSIINEAGVYALIFSSKLPQAKEFKCWVTHEVLPSIRKNGEYKDSENKYDKLNPVFTSRDLFNAMGRLIRENGGKYQAANIWRQKYIEFEKVIDINFYQESKKEGFRPIDWLKKNNYFDDFCRFVCS